MKESRKVIKALAFAGLALAMVSTVMAQTEQAAKVIRIKGRAQFSRDGGHVWQPLTPGAEIKAGTVIQTDKGNDSCVDLVLGGEGALLTPVALTSTETSDKAGVGGGSGQPNPNQDVVRLWRDTALSIDKLTAQPSPMGTVNETELDLKLGRITGNVKKMTAGSEFRIKLPNNGIAGIKGTGFDISVTGAGWVRVVNGAVVLAHYPEGTPPGGSPKVDVIQGGNELNLGTGAIAPLTGKPLLEVNTTISDLVRRGRPPFTPPGPPPIIPPVSPHGPK
jgi:hypothetical protein